MITDTRVHAAPRAVSGRLIAALASAVFGLVMLYTVGFVPLDAVHNAAHDSRHGAAFPCH